MSKKRIEFENIFKVKSSKVTKVKFNMIDGDGKLAWDNLQINEDSSIDDEWIRMNAHRSKKTASNDLDKAKYLLSFAQYYPLGPNYYIFGGLYKVKQKKPQVVEGFGYDLELQDDFCEYRKRLVIKLSKPIGRDIYTRWYENVKPQLNPEIFELLPFNTLGSFPGYADVYLTHKELQQIYSLEALEWKQALSQVKGVYCITDKATGELYIGSASGNNEGIWQRWKSYADINNLTGGNVTFEDIKSKDKQYIIDNFTYSILEIFDMRTKSEEIIRREEHWKKVFQTINHGMNNAGTKRHRNA